MAYSFAQLEQFAIQGGFPASYAAIMAAIAMAESSGNNVIQQGQPYSTTGWGLWQITPGNSVPSVGTDQALLNPVNNAKAAYIKWKGAGANEAALRSQWTTYRTGAYLKFLPAGTAPPPASDGSSGDVGSGSAPTTENAGILGDITGITALTNSLEHIFDVALNNVIYAVFVGLGVAGMGVGVILMVVEAASGGGVVGAAVNTVAKVVK